MRSIKVPAHPRPIGARRGRGLIAVAVTLALALATSACRGSTETAAADAPADRINSGILETDAKPRLGGSLAYGLPAETNGWNPTTNQWGPAGWEVARTIFDNLAAFDDQSQVHPLLAERIDHNEDFTEWTVTLRSGITYSDKSPVTAESVARTQQLLQASPVTGPGYQLVRTVAAAGPNQVVFSLTQPWTSFPTLLTTQVGVVAEPGWLATNDGLHPVGTGPFILDSWSVGQNLVVRKNPDYWQTDSSGTRYPYLDRVDFRVMSDGTARTSALEAGDIDIAQFIEPSFIKRFQSPENHERFQIFTNSDSEMTETFVLLNTQVAPFDDIDARRALAYATDRQGFVEVSQDGMFEPADGPFAKSSPWYTDSGYPDYDPVKAKELVDQVKERHGSFTFTLMAPSDPMNTASVQVLQQMYASVGIEVKLESVELSAAIIKAVSGGYSALMFGGWFYAHPDSDLTFIDPTTAYAPPRFTLNLSRNADPALTPMIDEFRAARELPAQREAMGRIVRQLNQDTPYIWLYHMQVAVIGSKKLANVVRYTLPDGSPGLDLKEGSHPLHQVWISA